MKLPGFVSKKNIPTEKILTAYKAWYHDPITQDFIKHLTAKLEQSLEKEEADIDFDNAFQFEIKSMHSLGYRKAYRELIKKLDYEVQ